MKNRQFIRSIVFVGAFGIAAPGSGCSWFDTHENEGRICGSPMEGGDYCMPANSGALAAWNDAMAHGSEPIQMWAEWPETVGVTQLVVNPQLLNAWLDDVQTVLDYLRITRGNAESYHASLSGKLGDRLHQALLVQERIMGAKVVNPSGRVEKVLLDKAAHEMDPLKAKVVADKQSMGEVLAIVEQTKVDKA